MGLLQLEMTAEVMAGLNDLRELHLVRSSVVDLGAGRFRIAGYGSEVLIPELESRGCTVEVVMTTAQIERFHDRVVDAVQTPQEQAATRLRAAGDRPQEA
jgi:hypothetical protein